MQWRIQHFPGGRQPISLDRKLIVFCRKLHENERNWTRGVPGAPLDPPMLWVLLMLRYIFSYKTIEYFHKTDVNFFLLKEGQIILSSEQI